jgi:hypothetical protein
MGCSGVVAALSGRGLGTTLVVVRVEGCLPPLAAAQRAQIGINSQESAIRIRFLRKLAI